MTDVRPPTRTRNPRGQGALLRQEILDGAGRVLDRTRREDAVTLRAVAREIGIAAPSIYPHFADREAMLTALVEQSFSRLQRRLERSHEGLPDPVDRLVAGSFAYLDFARDEPQRYRLMFGRTYHFEPGSDPPPVTAFRVLVGVVAHCAEAGRSTSTDPLADATAVFAGLHGYALLRTEDTSFPWPDEQALVRHLVCSLARIAP